MVLSKGDLKDSSSQISNDTSSPSYFVYLQPMPCSFIDYHWIHASQWEKF